MSLINKNYSVQFCFVFFLNQLVFPLHNNSLTTWKRTQRCVFVKWRLLLDANSFYAKMVTCIKLLLQCNETRATMNYWCIEIRLRAPLTKLQSAKLLIFLIILILNNNEVLGLFEFRSSWYFLHKPHYLYYKAKIGMSLNVTGKIVGNRYS